MSSGERSFYIRVINKFNEKFTNHEGKFRMELLTSYIFSKSILNIPIRVRNKIKYRFLGNKKSSSKDILIDLVLPDKENNSVIHFQQFDSPKVSIIIPVYNQIAFTIDCLISLYKNIEKKYSFEVIVVNDKSSDDTVIKISNQFTGVRVISNEENLGFVRSCNKGASAASGEYICFLNNDTYVQPAWLEELVTTIDTDASIGLVGSMLIYPNGILQEAGAIVWNNAFGWNYGRNENRFNTKYNYKREADYISGASILLRKKDFQLLGGFDELYVPAYYEDTDLCFSIRHKLNKKVVYCPASKIIHFEGITSGTSLNKGVKQYQVLNRTKFLNKWSSILNEKYLPQHDCNVEKSILKYKQKHILIIDSYVPCYNRESGSNRLFQIIKIINKLNYKITFLPDNELGEEPYTSELQDMGVEVLSRQPYYYESLHTQLYSKLDTIDIAWVCRPELFKKYENILSKNPAIKLIYDTIDLHFLRLKRENELFPNKKNKWEEVKKMELSAAQKSHFTLAITPVDEKILADHGVKNTLVVPNVHTIRYEESSTNDFETRSGLLFIGSYKHTPNIDAVEWLINDIMPLVWEKLPEVKVTLLGSKPDKIVKALESSKVEVPGFIDDVAEYFHSHKVFVAPLRYGAGMKGKIGQSLEYGLPIVSTAIGVEGMDMTDGMNVLVADDNIAFAESIIKLYTNQKLWNDIRLNSNMVLKPYTESEIGKTISQLLECL